MAWVENQENPTPLFMNHEAEAWRGAYLSSCFYGAAELKVGLGFKRGSSSSTDTMWPQALQGHADERSQ